MLNGQRCLLHFSIFVIHIGLCEVSGFIVYDYSGCAKLNKPIEPTRKLYQLI